MDTMHGTGIIHQNTQAFRGISGFFWTRAGENDQKFFSGPSAQKVAGPEIRGQGAGNCPEDGVAGEVAKAVVRLFETVEIEEDNSEPRFRPVRPPHFLADLEVAVAAIAGGAKLAHVTYGARPDDGLETLEPEALAKLLLN